MSNPRIPYRFSTSRPRLNPPQGKPLIVHVVVNVEHWPFTEPMPRKIITPPHGKESIPDIANFCWADYGMRCGLPRIMALLAERRIAASANINASAIDAYPEAAESMLNAGWEFIGHGMHQKSLSAVASEREVIEAAMNTIARFTGNAPRGWISPGMRETYETPDILKSCGIEYVCDWVVDDLPDWLTTTSGPMITIPYNLELNDSIIYAIQTQPSREMYQRLADTVETFEREMKKQVRVLALGLHPHLIGVPHRIGYLEKMLDLLCARQDAIFLQGGQIADWFARECPPPA